MNKSHFLFSPFSPCPIFSPSSESATLPSFLTFKCDGSLSSYCSLVLPVKCAILSISYVAIWSGMKKGIQIYFESNCQKRDLPSLIREVEVTRCDFFSQKKLMSRKTTKKADIGISSNKRSWKLFTIGRKYLQFVFDFFSI